MKIASSTDALSNFRRQTKLSSLCKHGLRDRTLNGRASVHDEKCLFQHDFLVIETLKKFLHPRPGVAYKVAEVVRCHGLRLSCLAYFGHAILLFSSSEVFQCGRTGVSIACPIARFYFKKFFRLQHWYQILGFSNADIRVGLILQSRFRLEIWEESLSNSKFSLF